MRKLIPLLLALLATSACHPLGCYYPQDLPTDRPKELKSDGSFPQEKVEVILDDLGIPHIFADDELDAAYGLGFMHTRDRAWQMLFLKHVSQGRLTELLGEDFLAADQFLRLISYPVDRTMQNLSPRARQVLAAYTEGVNRAAAEQGPTAEMDLLGVTFGTWEPSDTIGIMFYFVDDQSLGLRPEIARTRILNRLPPDHPVAEILLSGAPAGGVPIVTDETHSGAQAQTQAQTARARTLSEPLVFERRDRRSAGRLELNQRAHRMIKNFLEPSGHSNSWSVHGSLTDSGAPIMANDPHLVHQMPGVFYFAHLEMSDATAAGATIAGTPVVLIGHGRHVAWGITNAYGDCQDLVRLEPFEGRDDLYVLEGTPQNYGALVQRYKLGKEPDAPMFEETWRTTIFGPVIPPGREFLVDEGDTLAYQWCTDQFAEEMGNNMEAMLDLARATDIESADAALAKWVDPPLSFNLAFTDGTIAYRQVGYSVRRLRDDPIHLPRDGRFRDAGLGDPVPFDQKPQLTNPESGFIVASNQRIVDDDSQLSALTGREGSTPFRAQRITERLTRLLDEKSPDADEVLEIQLDITSVEAREAAPILGQACPSEVEDHPRERVLGFCTAVRNFNGEFAKDSLGALPYQFLITDLKRQVAVAHFGEEAGPDIANRTFTRAHVFEQMVRESQGEASPLFNDPNTSSEDGLDVFVARSAKVALDQLTGKCEGCQSYGDNPGDWRWGKAHTLTYENPLVSAPVIGGLFKTPTWEESGCKQCVRAEGPVPVSSGAGMRMIAEMTDPPVVRMIGDLGQVGHFGHKNSQDMYPLWTEGQVVQVAPSRAEIEDKNRGWLTISR